MITRISALALLVLAGCGGESQTSTPGGGDLPSTGKREKTPIPLDPNNIVSIAAGSEDHKTLVAALQAADYVRSISNPGPLTVFAPTDDAFAALPDGVLDDLLKTENQDKLREILKYHATTTAYSPEMLPDGMMLGMANGKKVEIKVVDGKLTVNGAKVLASIRGSNGYVHVVDAVLLPPSE